MGIFIQGFLNNEFNDLSEEELERLKAVTQDELYNSAEIKRILAARARQTLDSLRGGSGSGGA